MSRRKLLFRLVPVVVLMLGLTIGGLQVFAVNNDNIFEMGSDPNYPGGVDGLLDANILGDGIVANGPDWKDLFNPDGSAKDSNSNGNPDWKEVYGGSAATFIADDLSASSAVDRTAFSGGSNKNNDLISTWNWDSANSPAKDDITNAYAFAKLVGGHLIIYGGVERRSNNGDSHIDLEFNQQQISLDKAVPCAGDGVPAGDGAPCEFSGEKVAGDFIVSLDFSNGGTFGSLSVHRWDGTDYVEVGAITGEGCNQPFGSHPGDVICAFANNSTINDAGGWTHYTNNGNPTSDLLTNGFSEFGVDVTELLGSTPCIASLDVHTRSSQSFTAELKDFAVARFPLCAIAVEKSPSQGAVCLDRNTSVTYTYVVSNPGIAQLTVNLDDDRLGHIAGPFLLAASASRTFTAATTINITTTNTVTATGTNGPTAVFASTAVTVVARNCAIGVTKSPSIEQVCVGSNTPVTYTYTVNNPGDVTLSNVTLIDDRLGSITSGVTLAPGASQTFTRGTNISVTTTNVVTATGDALGLSPAATATATAVVNAVNCEIRGTKFKDVNSNRVRDSGELGLQGWQFQLKSGSTVLQTAMSDVSGNYTFTQVVPGTYTIHEILQTGWRQTTPCSGNPCLGIDPTVVVDPNPDPVFAPPFGNTPLSDITVTFSPQTSPPSTRAIRIRCVDSTGAVVRDVTNTNSTTVPNVEVYQSPVTCTVTYEDP